jgi:hypothetical protein
MRWREVLEEAAEDIEWGSLRRDAVGNRLLTMPPADRIALARELLEGTQRVVAREVEAQPAYLPPNSALMLGWNAARAAMLGDEG